MFCEDEEYTRHADVVDCSGGIGVKPSSVENFWEGFANMTGKDGSWMRKEYNWG